MHWRLPCVALLGCALVAAVAAEPGGAAPLPGGFTPNHRAIAAQAGPAVVGIEVVGMRAPESSEWTPDDVAPLPPLARKQPFHSQGSGFIISSDGLVLTSAHVIAGARRVTVRLSDWRQFRARVLGTDPTTDVAVLRVEAQGLPVLRPGPVGRLQVGDPVVTIGAPFGLEQSVSHGIVSATGRALPGFAAVPHIQTDAPVNPGHSGGPLLDASASVVGINSQIYTVSGGYVGLSFAVPIDVALRVKDQIVAKGRMSHGYLGVAMQNLDLTLARAFGLDRPHGALVSAVEVGSAAEKGGLRAGDIITAFNGQRLHMAGDLTSHMGVIAAGERVRLEVWRARASHELVVRMDPAIGIDDAVDPEARSPAPRELGWQMRPLSTQERQQLGVPGGLWVQAVSELSAQAGLQVGDVLLLINLSPVQSLDDLNRLTQVRPQQLGLLVDRDGERRFIPLELD